MHDPARILVVDDMAENVDFLKTRLESQGYEVVTVADGEAALAAMRESRPDFISSTS